MRIGNYTTHILVDDKELEEYDVKFETPCRVTCWIASEERKTFAIKWRCHAETRTAGNAGWVRVDDVFCGGLAMYPGRLGDGDTQEMSGVDLDTRTRDFMFSRIQLSDDDHLLNKEIPEGFGEISLEIEHGKLARDSRSRQKDAGVTLADDDKLHETSRKAGHHRINLGPERARGDRSSSCYLKVIYDDPSLFFVFRYRPIALLQAHGIVPLATPDPDTSQSNDLHEAELLEEIQYLENKLKRLRQKVEVISRKTSVKRVKHEDSAPGKQFRPVSVIDLTLD